MVQRADEQRNEEDDAGIGHRCGVVAGHVVRGEMVGDSWAGRTVRASDEKSCIHIYDGVPNRVVERGEGEDEERRGMA